MTPERLEQFLAAHDEWLLIHPTGRSFALRTAEIEVARRGGRVLLGFPDERGFRVWRVDDFSVKNDELVMRLGRAVPRETTKIRLVPRAAAAQLAGAVERARLEKAGRTAAALAAHEAPARLVRVALNQENGRLAEIFFERRGGRPAAALADVSESLTPEALLAAAMLGARRLAARKRRPIEEVFVVAGKKQAARLQALHALLRDDWRRRIRLREIVRDEAAAAHLTLKDLAPRALDDLWRGRRRAERAAGAPDSPGETARRIIALAPEAVDAVRSRHGETLRFRGLPFARVRRVTGREPVWLGVERAQRLLDEADWTELAELVDGLARHRRHDAPNRRHAFYEAAPEAWLESVLRRDIRRLDANLVLAPVHRQFRAGREKIDLLALRRDGRLVIIELKTSPDREMALQAADYWRQIERARRAGVFEKSGLFGTARIADRPPVCYAVAPTLAFHREFDFFAGALAPEIELHRFDLDENWRERIRVRRRG